MTMESLKWVLCSLKTREVDRCILELQMEAEDMYSRFRNAIENVWLAKRCW